ncbi:MAG: STAS/SEC14 domain-containing protein [Gammaproteobacteria bacterium]|nr:STAS/SEC14 domain-containing protein [Gammaproteobacteria bacterium]
MIEKLQPSRGKVIGYKLSGKLHDADYKVLVPEVEALIAQEGKIRLLAYLHEFRGWDLRAAWDDLAFDMKHYHDLERFALVGDKKWEEWMAKLSRPFTRAEVEYFPSSEIDAAWAWLFDGVEQVN